MKARVRSHATFFVCARKRAFLRRKYPFSPLKHLFISVSERVNARVLPDLALLTKLRGSGMLLAIAS